MTTATDDSIFSCSNKLMEHEKKYERFYEDRETPVTLRNIIGKISKKLRSEALLSATLSADGVKENYRIETKRLIISATFTSRSLACLTGLRVKSPETYTHFNKLCSTMEGSLHPTDYQALNELLVAAMSLHRHNYVFDSVAEPDFFNFLIESNKTRLAFDLIVEVK